MDEYYKLKYYVTESLYEKIVAENYTIAQAADRCLVEFWKQISDGGINALVIYSTLFSRTAFHSPEQLKHFQKQIAKMNQLSTPEIHQMLSEDALEELIDDIDAINQNLLNDGYTT